MNIVDLIHDGDQKCEQLEFKVSTEPDLVPEPDSRVPDMKVNVI